MMTLERNAIMLALIVWTITFMTLDEQSKVMVI